MLSERELFARLCTAAMLPEMEAAFADWRPELALRETCEYAAAVVATRRGVPHAQIAISQSENEAGALRIAAPVLEDYEHGVVEQILRSPYLTRFPASLRPGLVPGHAPLQRAASSRGRKTAHLFGWRDASARLSELWQHHRLFGDRVRGVPGRGWRR